jgi:S1-C subfamily serine protease
MIKLKQLIGAGVLCALGFMATPSAAWESVKGMNEQIDQTNFVVRGGCSGTLIDVENRLIVTAHHCVSSFIKKVVRDVVDEDGAINKVTYEKLLNVPVWQNDYHNFENVGTLTYQTKIVAYKQERDIAILQLVGDNLRSTMAAPVLPEGKVVYRGEPVTAVGNPLGFDATVTTGVVSSTTRTFQVPWALNGSLTPTLMVVTLAEPCTTAEVVLLVLLWPVSGVVT